MLLQNLILGGMMVQSPKPRVDVFISSTILDLPEYRTAVEDAILQLGLFPSRLERWPVKGDNSVNLCKGMVEDAEIYLGIYAHRYGWRPDGDKSITEMEYDWAGDVKRHGRPIPRLCFIVDDKFAWPKDQIELDAQDALNAFKARVKQNQVGFFTTPEDLKAQVIAALVPHAKMYQQDTLLPYLRWLHKESSKSGLLHVLNPRDASVDTGRSISIEQVYTSLDTRKTAYRDENGRLLSVEEVMQMKREVKDEAEESRLTAMEAANLTSHLVLLGDPGSGKSTFVSFLALCLTGHMLDAKAGWLDKLSEQGWQHGSKLPVLVTLREFAQDVPEGETEGSANLLFQHIERQLIKWKLEEAYSAIQYALNEGQALVLLDGLDEVPPAKRDIVRDTVQDFITRCHSDNRYLVTCRILSYTNPEWQIPDMAEETIAPFDEDKINHFIQAWYTALQALRGIDEETAGERVKDLTERLSGRYLDIAENPMLLTVMTIVHNHTGALPRETARLYEECVKLLMMRWRPYDAQALIEKLGVGEHDIYRILWEIAYDAHDKQGENEGSANIPQWAVEAIAQKRLGDRIKAVEFCEYVEERAGLLIGRGVDSYGLKIFSFPHRTFQEYLAGCHVASERFTRRLPELARRGAGWREALLLATGHLVFNQFDNATPLDAINTMCPERLKPQNEDDWRLIWLAGDMLLLVGQKNAENDEVGLDVLPRIRQLLADLVSGGHLPPVERAAVGRVLSELGDPRPGVGLREDGLPDIVWCEVPTGTFLMGSDKKKDLEARENEMPQREVNIPYTYRISQYPITQAQFQAFLDAEDGFENLIWWANMPEEYQRQTVREPEFSYANHPREKVSWYHAVAFTQWLTARYQTQGLIGPDETIRLPTESEWEKAARGTDGRIYPYENRFDAAKGNTAETGIRQTSAVGIFPDGASPYKALDMSGNVFEWCLTKDQSSHDEADDNGADARAEVCVIRGGSWQHSQGLARAAESIIVNPRGNGPFLGFRIVHSSSL